MSEDAGTWAHGPRPREAQAWLAARLHPILGRTPRLHDSADPGIGITAISRRRPAVLAAKPQSRKALCLKVKIFPELHPVPSSDRLFLGSHCMRCGPHLRYIHKWRRTWTSGRRFGWKKPHQVMRHGFLFLTKRILRSECLARTLRRKKRTWQRSRITCFLLWRD